MINVNLRRNMGKRITPPVNEGNYFYSDLDNNRDRFADYK